MTRQRVPSTEQSSRVNGAAQAGKRHQIILAQRANVDRYPPVVNQARLLSEISRIEIVDYVDRADCDEVQTDPNVGRLRVDSQSGSTNVARLRRIASTLKYKRLLTQQINNKPDIVIAYDADAGALLLRAATEGLTPRRVVHLHELLDPSLVGRSTKVSTKWLIRKLSAADLVIVPDAHRARHVSDICGLQHEPMVVMNTPLRLQELPQSSLLPELNSRGISSSGIVHYQGAIGPEHHLEAIISSMRHWPDNAVFVLVGGASDQYRAGLLRHASSLGVAERVIFLGRIAYHKLFAYAFGAAVGITLLEPTTENWRLSAGASNKRFEYAALGIPQITNAGAGMEEIFGKPGLALLLDRFGPEEIGRAIASLLLNDSRRGEMGHRARAAHLSVNHYERQFAPVLAQFESWLH